MPGCIVSATTASFKSMENRRRRATPVITSTFENVSDIGVCLGLSLGPPAKAGVRSKQGAIQCRIRSAPFTHCDLYTSPIVPSGTAEDFRPHTIEPHAACPFRPIDLQRYETLCAILSVLD